MERAILPANHGVEKLPDLDAIMKNLMNHISGSGLSKEKEAIVIQRMKTLKKHQKSFLTNHFLYYTMKEFCADQNLGKPLLDRAGAIIVTEELPSHIRVQRPPPLTPEEKQELRYMAEERIIGRIVQRKNLMYESGMQDADWFPFSEGENIFNEAKRFLSEDLQAYNAAAHLYLDKTIVLWNALDKSTNVARNNLEWLEKRCSLLYLKLRILECKISLAFFTEEPKQIEALEILENVLKEKLSELKTELQKLQSALTHYNILRGTEYDAVLNQYIGVLKKLKEQKWLLNHVSNR